MRRALAGWLVIGALVGLVSGCTGAEDSSDDGPVDDPESSVTDTGSETASIPPLETPTTPSTEPPVEAPLPPPTTLAPDPVSGDSLPTGGSMGADGAPTPGNDAGSTGPLGGSSEADRIAAVMPDLSDRYWQLNGADALPLIRLLGRYAKFGFGFSLGTTLVDCAFDEGLLAARYVYNADNTTAGAVLMISLTRLNEIPDVIVSCLTPDPLEDVLGGGESEFSPCYYDYVIDVPFPDGSQDRYAVFVAGTHEQTCVALYTPHSVYGFQELTF